MTRPVDPVAVRLYGRTAQQAVEARECVRCHRDVDPDISAWSEIDRSEYWISAFCPECWTAVMEPAS